MLNVLTDCVLPQFPCKNDRVEKLKQIMCGGIGHMSGSNPEHMHGIAQNKLKDNIPCICFKRYCQLLWLAYISIDSIGICFHFLFSCRISRYNGYIIHSLME